MSIVYYSDLNDNELDTIRPKVGEGLPPEFQFLLLGLGLT